MGLPVVLYGTVATFPIVPYPNPPLRSVSRKMKSARTMIMRGRLGRGGGRRLNRNTDDTSRQEAIRFDLHSRLCLPWRPFVSLTAGDASSGEMFEFTYSNQFLCHHNLQYRTQFASTATAHLFDNPSPTPPLTILRILVGARATSKHSPTYCTQSEGDYQ